MRFLHLEDKVYPQPDNKVIRVIETLDIDVDEIMAMLSRKQVAGIATEQENYLVVFKSGKEMGVSKSFFEQINAAWMKPIKLQA